MSNIISKTRYHSSYGDSWTHQHLIPRPIPGGLREALDGLVASCFGMPEPGQMFHRQPIIVRRTRRYVVVHQSGGYDV